MFLVVTLPLTSFNSTNTIFDIYIFIINVYIYICITRLIYACMNHCLLWPSQFRVPFWALTFVWPRLAYESFMASRLDGYASGNPQGSADNRPPVSPGKGWRFACCFPAFFVRGGVREHCQFLCWMILGAFWVSSGRAEVFFNLWMIFWFSTFGRCLISHS